MLSGLSLLELNEMEARYASYLDLATLIRQKFSHPKATLRELFARLVFNILVGNTDDHARNHAAFWNGKSLTLTPAYDICPQMRVGQVATQAMAMGGAEGNDATLANALSVAEHFLLSPEVAQKLIDVQLKTIRTHWDVLCEEVKLTERDKTQLWGNVILSKFALRDSK